MLGSYPGSAYPPKAAPVLNAGLHENTYESPRSINLISICLCLPRDKLLFQAYYFASKLGVYTILYTSYNRSLSILRNIYNIYRNRHPKPLPVFGNFPDGRCRRWKCNYQMEEICQ